MNQIYSKSAFVLSQVFAKKGTVKGLSLNLPNVPSDRKKQIFAIVTETLKNKTIIDEIINSVGIFKSKGKQFRKKYPMILILIYEFLIGNEKSKNNQKNNSKKRRIRKFKFSEKDPLHKHLFSFRTQIVSQFARLKIKENSKSSGETKSNQELESIFRYARINILKCNKEDAIQHFISENFHFIENIEKEKPFGDDNKGFYLDFDVPNLFVFASGTDLHQDTFVINGSIILQDKASCFPALALNPSVSDDVIDACAAPGNKTFQIYELMKQFPNNSGKLFAFDLDFQRTELLRKRLNVFGAKNVIAQNEDFLKVNPNDPLFSSVKKILVDPSCSGTGIIANQNIFESANEERIKSLASFQKKILLHALSFKNVERVVYSTCSITIEENEGVVDSVLKEDFVQNSFHLENIFPKWKRRGLNGFVSCIRCSFEDKTNGFFVASFVRNLSQKKSNKKRKKKIQSNENLD
ncbi:28s rRNA (cytosine-c(5))-methyltransferase-related [Anaeramoeba ignava]|uniref:28s rRNA (Cytosine-c(5))-methyltransferase-related n=1 Tax=Anaeramoeba ignava TaxID=1746090 RepID=A0A9Q0RGL0_ANAIG|nr:28s rRNA (cytosine-c(5))-methyltransferase-related [Anaeramoeba ignava]